MSEYWFSTVIHDICFVCCCWDCASLF